MIVRRCGGAEAGADAIAEPGEAPAAVGEPAPAPESGRRRKGLGRAHAAHRHGRHRRGPVAVTLDQPRPGATVPPVPSATSRRAWTRPHE